MLSALPTFLHLAPPIPLFPPLSLSPTQQLTGHFHAGAAAEQRGVHYVTLEGLVEAPLGSTSWAVVTVDEGAGAISIEGGGYATARKLRLAPRAAAPGSAAAAAAS